MNEIISSNKVLFIALLNVTLLSFAQAYGNGILIALSIALFCSLVILSTKELFLALMLFYLPWGPIIKMQPDGFTFFTLIIPIVFLILIFKHKKIDLQISIITFFFLTLTILAKMIYSYGFSLEYGFILMMFLFIPTYYKSYNTKIEFKKCVYYLFFGIIAACISSQVLMKIPHMLAYIYIDSAEHVGLLRFNGFYGDANFYSAQILAAISGLLVLIGENTEHSILNYLLIVILLFFGLQSVSKMFLLITAALLFVWFIFFIIDRRAISKKIGITLLIAITVVSVVTLNIFQQQINYYFIRFGMITDVNSLTTGRSSILMSYLNYFNTNILSTFFGVGLSFVLVNNRASHNTIIEVIYQLGLVGGVGLLLWVKLAFRDANASIVSNKFNRHIILLFIGCFASWLALDMLTFDEFFYFILFFFMGKKYLNCNKAIFTEGHNNEDKKIHL
ncbi:hypothetical protein JK636_04370 [Clostridium sp. YIM B02515]|uniref:O-antigen ligase domain-containing protein n=1 Tax=Clostridium rhizosphaerae TaxID=2803861 RepID=A0ABS1T6Q9_9CLOT|nr:hypothetical protein [Clostridium rhizosphaerae]MBL4934990.1 hypothetical protein [Clostridium rhizosphaerae]